MKSTRTRTDVTIATAQQKGKLADLWRACFHCDTDFIKLFLEHCLPLSNTYVLTKGDTAVSALTVLRVDCVGEERLCGGYVYGLCTDPAFRNQGCAERLLRTVEKDSRSRGLDFLLLRPAENSLFTYYRKRGFERTLSRQHLRLPLEKYGEPTFNTRLTPETFQMIRKENLCGNYFEWDKYTSDFILSYYTYLGGDAVELDGNRYLVGFPDPEDRTVYEILEIGTDRAKTLKPTLEQASAFIRSRNPECRTISLFLPPETEYEDVQNSETEPFVLLKPLSKDCPENAFFNFSME